MMYFYFWVILAIKFIDNFISKLYIYMHVLILIIDAIEYQSQHDKASKVPWCNQVFLWSDTWGI
jgi:hypothetical protein